MTTCPSPRPSTQPEPSPHSTRPTSAIRRQLHRSPTLSDAELTDAVARVISLPKAEPADSFILHAPLELLARSALLTLVEPDERDAGPSADAVARRHLRRRWRHRRPAPRRTPDRPPPTGARPSRCSSDLESAIDRGDLEGAEVAAATLADILPPADLGAALTDVVLPRLSAAAHGNIFLFQLPRIAPRSRAAGEMARGLVRELARYPDWNLTWHLDRAGRRRPAGRTSTPEPSSSTCCCAPVRRDRSTPTSSSRRWRWSSSRVWPPSCSTARPARSAFGPPADRSCGSRPGRCCRTTPTTPRTAGPTA